MLTFIFDGVYIRFWEGGFRNMAETMADNPKTKGKKTRSPNYPGVSLETAITRAKEFYEKEKRSAANIAIAAAHWGFKPKSSGGIVTIAALKAFGLLDDQGSGDKRTVRLSDLALRILLDQRSDSPERDGAIKEAAIKPSIHSRLWKEYGTDLPSDENLSHKLVFDFKFNENAVRDFIREYRDTIKFANLSGSDTISECEEDKVEETNMVQTIPAASGSKPPTPPSSHQFQGAGKEISLPVGVSDEGQAIFAHVRFDAPLKKGMLTSLQQLLAALEKSFS
jgi:hypothetical protein